jgi:hypothetical protein
VPAAAVIPALKMHRIIAAVKKLVVGSVPTSRSILWMRTGWLAFPPECLALVRPQGCVSAGPASLL